MAIVRWNPFGELQQLQHEMNRLFSSVSRDRESNEPADASTWSPLTDVVETEGGIVMQVELPGVDPKKVDLRLENNVMTIRGERPADSEFKKENWLRMERPYGSFTRSFSMPMAVDDTKVRAEFKNGVLSIFVPKKEQPRPKQIPISA